MYSCGPTVYRRAHLGNLRSYLMADWIRRALECQGLTVIQVKNITDVGHMRQEVLEQGEDKVVAAAIAEGKTPAEIAQFYTERFENDEQADYPYRRDRKGYNVYGGVFVHPDVRVTLGRLRERQLVARGRNRATYVLVTADFQAGAAGRLRVFQDLRRVRDDIADNLVQWLQLPNTRGDLVPVLDPVAAPDTWINTTWVGWEFEPLPGLHVDNKAKWQLYHQLDEERQLLLRGLRDRAAGRPFRLAK